jgi:uncharacterized protein
MPFDQTAPRPRLNIAIIGTGIAGMSSAWLLSRDHDITVYEKNQSPGGHSNTVDAAVGGSTVPVDTGFIVYNELTYPNLTALFRHLDVPTVDSDMSFAASLNGGELEYAGSNLNGLFGQRRNLIRPRFWRMIRDLVRFYRTAPNIVDSGSSAKITLGEYCRRFGYDDAFITDHLQPIGSAIWSTSTSDMLEYPVESFVRFFVSHGLFNFTNRPAWRTVEGGSREYVRRLSAPYAKRIHFGGVKSVRRHLDRVEVLGADDQTQEFDHVIIATHADEALALLDDADDGESSLLGVWRYTNNRAVLHTDSRLMPLNRRVWSSWNFLGDQTACEIRPACVTYWMNRLQPLATDHNLFVTLNPGVEIQPNLVLQDLTYTHPYFDRAALDSQDRLWSLQGRKRTWFCGSYLGYGFHEDALQSGLAVAEQVGGVRRPWNVENENGRIRITEDAGVVAP